MKKIRKNKLSPTTFSGVACHILLIIYENQLRNIELVEDLKIGFESNVFSGKNPSREYYNKFDLAATILSITNNYSILIGGFRYLKDKDFLRFNELEIANDGYVFCNFHLTDKGIDIIENAKNNPLKNREFARTFNLSLAFNVDGIIKANNIVGVGGAASANLDVKTRQKILK